MHKLEYALFALATIEEKENKNLKLSKELYHLASISHNYTEPRTSKEDLTQEHVKNMHERSDKLIHSD